MGKGSDGIFLFGGIALIALVAGSSKKSNSMPDPSSNNDIRLPFDGKLTTYVKLAYPYALEASKQYPKIPTTLILTQSGLESAYGKAAPGNMFFGVKAGKNYTGDKQLLKTTEVLPKATGYAFPEVISITPTKDGKYRWVVRDYFRKYPTPLGSFLDYCKLLYTPRYAKVLTASPNVNNMIAQIKAAGYATDPNYVPKLQKLAALVSTAEKNVA
jgi:flagellum-specific peptidoglycan hydrolase FlgJ